MSDRAKFGTSGLRGSVASLDPQTVARYTHGFLTHLASLGNDPTDLCLGIDLRPSSPTIAQTVASVAADHGVNVIYAGAVPTPALANYSLAHKIPSIMVTGSHNPVNENGLKFYLPNSELRKEDEPSIEHFAATEFPVTTAGPLPAPAPEIRAEYKARFRNIFPGDPLSGLRIGVDLHSAVGGPLLVEILEELGAQCKTFGKTDSFVAVDTEALDPARLEGARIAIAASQLDAVASTDGDGDRPLLIDGAGNQIGGDVLGLLAAHFLGYSAVVTPVSSTTAIEKSGYFRGIRRTRIGSPYVITAMLDTLSGGAENVAGFEANGGFLTGGTFKVLDKPISPLMTRDAILPLVSVLALAKALGKPLAELTAALPSRVMVSNRLPDYTRTRAAALLENLRSGETFRVGFLKDLAQIAETDETDGLRMTLGDGAIVHFRPSGNAEELRCYVETDTRAASDALLARALAAAADFSGA